MVIIKNREYFSILLIMIIFFRFSFIDQFISLDLFGLAEESELIPEPSFINISIIYKYYTCQLINYQRIHKMNEKQVSSNSLSQQQLRQRRREKILARAAAKNQNQYDRQSQSRESKQISSQKEKSKESATSAFEMFNASKKYSKLKFTLQMIGIIVGIATALIHQVSSKGSIIFTLCFLLVALSSAYLEVTKANKVQKFTRESAIQDPLIEKISGIKQLDIANKLLNLQASISPITKLISAYFLLTVLLGLAY